MSAHSHRPPLSPETSDEPTRTLLSSPAATPSTAAHPGLVPPNPAFASRPYSLPGSTASSRSEITPYGVTPSSSAFLVSSISEKYALAVDPAVYNHSEAVEADDDLHRPELPQEKRGWAAAVSSRGLVNLGCLFVLIAGLIALFAGYPVISHYTRHQLGTNGGFNIGGTNSTGQVPDMGNFGLIDKDTPKDAYTKAPYTAGGSDWQLVFSDEFNTDGRSFYPGDDPYWEAVDLHYWQTNNLEWYDPAAITTANGSLKITLSKKETHGLNYQGGMMSTWNKFCFTGGLIETSVQLPGVNNIVGLWPAIWTMGNLGRAGYGASLEGMWPYTYDACDVGTVANQSINGVPAAVMSDGDQYNDGLLSFLPGQKLSRCTCSGESHPGPKHSDGTYVGRSAPEIDIFEAQITGKPLTGQVSQSSQWGPFNHGYIWFNSSDNLIIYNESITEQNSYIGGVYQQAISGVTETDQQCYEGTGGCFSVYGFEYQPGFDDAYITWISDGKAAWTMKSGGVAADTIVEISARPIPQEPLYIIVNLGMSTNFGYVDLDHLTFPTTMSVDWIRVYQPSDNINIGCDPKDFPTQAYINAYIEAYTNQNLTTWRDDYGQPFPKNSYLGQC